MLRPDLQVLADKIRAALPVAESMANCPPEILAALQAAQGVLRQAGQRLPAPGEKTVPWTVQDAGGCQIDVLLHYEWEDYCPGDRVTPSSGGCARIVDVEVVEVRYFDDWGEVITLEQQQLHAVWEAVEKNRELLEEMCTDAGHRADVGRSSPLYFPGPGQAGPAGSDAQGWRMAPSARARSEKEPRRKQG